MIINVVICTFDRYDLLEGAIGSVLRQDLDSAEYQVTVIDNSPDAARSREMAARWRPIPNLRWQHEPVAGLSRARNLGLAAASTPLVAFLDDDAIAAPSWLARMVEAFATLGPAVHCIGGLVRLRFHGERPAWLDDELLIYLSECDLGDETRVIGPDEWVVGANIAYRTAAVKQAGGFSVALGRVGGGASLMSNDETELRERMAALGGLVGYAPRSQVDHVVLANRLDQGWFRKRLAWQAVSDFVRAPEAMQDRARDAWKFSRQFLAALPPADRTLRGLAVPQRDAPAFQAQIGAIYDTVHALLSGLRDPDGL